MAGALDGVRVLELAEGVAGPYCGKLFAGLGADVLKLESPEGDASRREGPFPGDRPDPERSGLFLHLNTGKRGAIAERSLGLPRDLLEAADVLLLGARPKELAAMGVDCDALSRSYPRLVIVNVSPFGLTGPYADYRGGELVEYALSGYMMLTGSPDREPIKAYGSLVEYQAGAHAALGTIAALFARERTGRGQLVDVSAMEAGTFMLGGVEQRAYFYGAVARRNGTRLLGFPPQHSYPSTIRPCKDGFVHCHSNNRYLDLLGALIPHPRLVDPEVLGAMMGHADEIDAIMDEWLADRDRFTVTAAAQELRLPFTEVMEPGEVMADEHHRLRGSFVTVDHPVAGPLLQPGAPMRMSATPWVTGPAPVLGSARAEFRPRAEAPRSHPRTAVSRPLEGMRVIDFTNAVAGPIAASILGDLGADVIKVEAPNARPRHAAGTAPLAPGAEDRTYDRIMIYNELNHGKRGVSLDVARPEGRDVFLRLVAKADVVVQNFAPRVLGNLGLDYEALRAVNPGIVLISMPAFGLDGPYRDRVAYGPGVDAMSGLSHLTGYEDGPPMKPGNFFCDQNAGVHAAFSAVAALRHRQRTGEGQHVELAMIEGEFQILGDAYIDFAMNGRERRRAGNRHPWMAPHAVFPCLGEDAWVAIAVVDDAQWRALCGVIGRPELADEPQFATASRRKANEDALFGPIAAWTRQRGHLEAQSLLQEAGIPAGAVLDALELLRDPHVVARHGFEYVDAPGVGPTPYPRVAFTLSGTPVPIALPAPGFAEHNDVVFRGLLGLGEEEVAELEATGIISRVPAGAAH
ncbi:MAG: CoA transferase [Chloroflexi bacterium]|nr:CoA transferase [Chloroflexota bacterium]